MWAIIGGSGFEQFDDFVIEQEIRIETSYGEHSSGLAKAKIGEVPIVFLPRHGKRHEKLPSEVNYIANIDALRQLGVTKILSLSAVGSYDLTLAPGDAVVPTQYVDQTKGLRRNTFAGDGLVAHVSVKQPAHPQLVALIAELKAQVSFNIHLDKVYVCEEGPHFATLHEAYLRKQQGIDIVGQTNYPEYVLVKEAGIAYLPVCFVSNYDAWTQDVPDLPMADILNIIKDNKNKAFKLAHSIISRHPDILATGCAEEGLEFAKLN